MCTGATALFECLPYCNLRTLNLHGNGLTSDCCSALCTALTANALIEQLVLSNNAITDAGAGLIARGLYRNVFLQALDLSQNKIDNEGLDHLCACLSNNHTLSTLATYQNVSSDDRAELIVNARMKQARLRLVGTPGVESPMTAGDEYSKDVLNALSSVWKNPIREDDVPLGRVEDHVIVESDQSLVPTNHQSKVYHVDESLNHSYTDSFDAVDSNNTGSTDFTLISLNRQSSGLDSPNKVILEPVRMGSRAVTSLTSIHEDEDVVVDPTPDVAPPPKRVMHRQTSLVLAQIQRLGSNLNLSPKDSPVSSADGNSHPHPILSRAGSMKKIALSPPFKDGPMGALSRSASILQPNNGNSVTSPSGLLANENAINDFQSLPILNAVGEMEGVTAPILTSIVELSRVNSFSGIHKHSTRIVEGASNYGKRPLTRELSLSNFLLATSANAPGSRSGGVGLNREKGEAIPVVDNTALYYQQSNSSENDLAITVENSNTSTSNELDKMKEKELDSAVVHNPSYFAPMTVTGHYSSTPEFQSSSYHSAAFTPTVDYTESKARFDYTEIENTQLDVEGVRTSSSSSKRRPQRRQAMMVTRNTSGGNDSGEDGNANSDTERLNSANSIKSTSTVLSTLATSVNADATISGASAALQQARQDARMKAQGTRPRTVSRELKETLYGHNKYPSQVKHRKENTSPQKEVKSNELGM